MIEKAKKNLHRIVTSAYSIVEVNKLEGLAKGTLREDQSKMILEFFQNSYIFVRPVTRQVAELAHEFTRTHKLRNADALHVATAIVAKVDVLYTWDERKQRRGGLLPLNGKIGTPPLRIEPPPDPDEGTFFVKTEDLLSLPPPEPPATQS